MAVHLNLRTTQHLIVLSAPGWRFWVAVGRLRRTGRSEQLLAEPGMVRDPACPVLAGAPMVWASMRASGSPKSPLTSWCLSHGVEVTAGLAVFSTVTSACIALSPNPALSLLWSLEFAHPAFWTDSCSVFKLGILVFVLSICSEDVKSHCTLHLSSVAGLFYSAPACWCPSWLLLLRTRAASGAISTRVSWLCTLKYP